MDRLEPCGSWQSTMMAISDDMLIQILIRLSTKSLLQLKPVCKRWLSLISSHHFSVLHTLRHPTATTSTALLLRQLPSKFYHLSRDTIKIHLHDVSHFTLPCSNSNIIQSCHGLLLCRNISNIPSEYYVYNLATRLSRKLYVDRTNAILGVSLAFDPSKSAYYKVICVRTMEKSVFCYQVMVFNSKSCSWSVVVENFSAPDGDFSNGVYWNNAIHWPRPKGDSVYFDVDKGVICKFPKTPVLNWRRFSEDMPLLVESGGHLHFSIIDGSKLIVFEMERDYCKWSKKYSVEYSRISSAFLYERICLFGIMRRQKEEQCLLLFHVPGRVMAYNFIDGSFEELINLRQNNSRIHSLQFGPHDVHQFVTTLAPV